VSTSRQQAADAWLKALIAVIALLALMAAIVAGNTFGDWSFNGAAAFIAALAVVVPTLPWIGLFHVLSRREEQPTEPRIGPPMNSSGSTPPPRAPGGQVIWTCCRRGARSFARIPSDVTSDVTASCGACGTTVTVPVLLGQ
jgi:hypothetical protein